jgi:predicted transcriptional regulator
MNAGSLKPDGEGYGPLVAGRYEGHPALVSAPVVSSTVVSVVTLTVLLALLTASP